MTLEDGRTVEGSHCLLAVGSVPNTAGIGLAEAGVELTRLRATSRSTGSRAPRSAGSTPRGTAPGVLPLASVAAMQGRIAMWHALGDAVAPINLKAVAANIFTDPEIATVGYSAEGDRRRRDATPTRSCCRWRPTPGPRWSTWRTAS